MYCPFCKSNLSTYKCFNHKFIIRLYPNQICFDINSRYSLFVIKDDIYVFDYLAFKAIITINNISKIYQITPDNAESILDKLISLKAFL